MNDASRSSNSKLMSVTTIVVGLSALLASVSAPCQTAGSWSIALGYNNIAPQGTSDPLSPPSFVNSTTKVGSDAEPIVNVAYNYTDHLSVQVGLGTPYSHKLYGAGSLQGVGELGSMKQLPPTIFGQYHFMEASAPIRPYAGVGITYAIFGNETGSGTLTAITNAGGPPTTFTVDNAWGVTPELGVTLAFNSKWFADIMVGKTYLNTTVHLSTGQSASASLNPIVSSVSIGYRF